MAERENKVVLPILQQRLSAHPAIGFSDTVHYLKDERWGEDRRAYVIASPKIPSLDPEILRDMRDEIAKGLHPGSISTDYQLTNPDTPEGYLQIGVLHFYENLYQIKQKIITTKGVYDQDFANLKNLINEKTTEVNTHVVDRNTYLGIFPHESIAQLYRDFLKTYSRFGYFGCCEACYSAYSRGAFYEMEVSLRDIFNTTLSRMAIKYFSNPDLLQQELDYLIKIRQEPHCVMNEKSGRLRFYRP